MKINQYSVLILIFAFLSSYLYQQHKYEHYKGKLVALRKTNQESMNFQERANNIWSIADLLKSHYKPYSYGKIILPFVLLRRLDELLEPTKEKVLDVYEKRKKLNPVALENLLNQTAGYQFHNHSIFNLKLLANNANHLLTHLQDYINGFSQQAKEIFEYFNFEMLTTQLDEDRLLLPIVKELAAQSYKELTPQQMGDVFERLIRKYAETSCEKTGNHFTPREVIELMVNILFNDENEALPARGNIRTVYDPACGTGGALSVSDAYLKMQDPEVQLKLFGQDSNPESYAICKSQVLIKKQNPQQIKPGNSFLEDGLKNEQFDYMLCNPPLDVEWKKEKKFIEDEHDKQGFAGRFGPGLPRTNDGSMLFLLHMISKMKHEKQGSRIGIIFNSNPLLNGGAGSGESNIRQWMIEKDYLEAIIGLPNQLFYHTNIYTYLWIINNRKNKERRSKIQLINARERYKEMTPKLNNKCKFITPEQIEEIMLEYTAFKESKTCKIFDNSDFGYHHVAVERPQKDEEGNIVRVVGKPVADSELRYFENIPLKENIKTYFEREILPRMPDAWIDYNTIKIGYEIDFDRTWN